MLFCLKFRYFLKLKTHLYTTHQLRACLISLFLWRCLDLKIHVNKIFWVQEVVAMHQDKALCRAVKFLQCKIDINPQATFQSRSTPLLQFDRCDHCKQMEPEYDRAAAALHDVYPHLHLAKVDATVEVNVAAR